jgi:hypothetical protein
MWRALIHGDWFYSFDRHHFLKAPAGLVPKLSTLDRLRAEWDETLRDKSLWRGRRVNLPTVQGCAGTDGIELITVTGGPRVPGENCECCAR